MRSTPKHLKAQDIVSSLLHSTENAYVLNIYIQVAPASLLEGLMERTRERYSSFQPKLALRIKAEAPPQNETRPSTPNEQQATLLPQACGSTGTISKTSPIDEPEREREATAVSKLRAKYKTIDFPAPFSLVHHVDKD